MALSSYRESLITVAKLYYLGNMPQNDIAKLMGLSRPKISRMLKSARDMKIVQFQITTPSSHYSSLEQKIRDAFGLRKVIVVPSEPSADATKQNVGKALADYFSSIIKDNDIIGIAWGSTTSSILRHMQDMQTSGTSIWQLCAGLPTQVLELDGHEITKRLANSIHAEFHVLNAPFVVNNALLQKLLMEEPEISHHFSMFNKMDIAIVGLGSTNPSHSMTYQGHYITLEESRELVDMGCAADICGHRLYEDGAPANVYLEERMVSIGLPALKRIPNVIGTACGEDKTTSIIATARGGYINTLVIDEIAAIAVIKKLGV